jgi:hypothetical protein
MKTTISVLAAVPFGLLAMAPARATELAELKVLYVGSERASEFGEFLEDKVAQVAAKSRADFKVDDATPFDVVLLDWPQGEETREMRKLTSPLGDRDQWNKPTVLLGSAGLNLAVAWKLKGGTGCTCMDPLAYDLRDHEIFARPFTIDRSKMVSIPTPPDFQNEIKTQEIKVLALVDDLDRKWRSGWCTYAKDFAQYPDVEFFCGGVNHKTPTAAGLWRQGNLLHFGFEQSPAEMNDMGQRLLLNAIAYISRFKEDRPIAITPSGFAGPVARSRSVPARWLRNRSSIDAVKDLVAPEMWEQLSALPNPEKIAEWADQNTRFLHPNSSQQLEIDEDLREFEVAFDQPEFFGKAFAALRSDDAAVVARARRLLERYVPTGPQLADADRWVSWWNENRPYAFASDAGDYRWYVDPLAKRRGVSTAEMRGPKRADPASPSSTASQ